MTNFSSHGRLAHKVALITGGTSGIGAATAQLFAREGANVVFTGRRVKLGEAVVAGIKAEGGTAHYIAADHTLVADCERAVAETVARHGRLDILFNNAGIVTSGRADTTTLDTWQATLDLNITAVWQMSRLVLPHFRAQGGGVIINNASDWGLVGGRNALAYSVSKGAVVQMTRSMALDHARENIRINAVCPGDTFVTRWVEQGYFADTVSGDIEPDLADDALPMGRVGRANEIAQAVLFLASDDSSYVTGIMLPVDGGNTAE
jgi:NAD(P)-dependent dehydrogenase (short-subunit alcohol dehydrogenase family)